jgi:hypothetical protein
MTGQSTLDTPVAGITSPDTRPVQVADWKAQAIEAYHQRRPYEDRAMRLALTERVQVFTRCTVAIDAIMVDLDEQFASAVVDSVLFRWGTTGLAILRPCASCGSGRFASPSLTSQADVGYAITVWQPHNPNCQPEDPTNWLDNDL